MRLMAFILLSFVGAVDLVVAQEPLVLSHPEGPITEISARVITEAYKRLDLPVQIIKLPSDRSLTMANKGEVDGVVSRIQEIENTYQNLIRVPVVVNVIEAVVFTKNLKITTAGWETLKPYTIGIKRGTKFAEIGTKGMNVISVDTNNQLFLMLDTGRVDAIVTARMAGIVVLNELKLKNIYALEPPLETKNLYHYLHKKNGHVISELISVLQSMETEGQIKKIRTQAIADMLN